ncbi:MAG: nuclear transport factor 2 family protein [Gemmataceae bacterium]
MNGIFEGPTLLYLLLLIAVAVLVALWGRDRRTLWLALLSVPAVLIVALYVLDRAVETPREQISRKLREMAQAVQRRDAQAISAQLAANFSLGGRDRATFQKYVERVFREGWVTDLVVWDIQTQLQGSTAEATLNAKLRGPRVGGSEFFRVKTQWKLEANQWRLLGFSVHNPYVETDRPLEIPDLP